MLREVAGGFVAETVDWFYALPTYDRALGRGVGRR